MRARLRSRAAAQAVVAALTLALGSAASASPVDLFGLGARGQALAGVVVSTASGFESTYYNPSGLAFDERPTFTLGYQSATFTLRQDGVTRPTRDAPLLTIGFGVPLPFGGALTDRVAIGLGFAIPQSAILIADIARPGDPTFILVENRAQTVSVLGSIAIRVTDWLGVGIGALALAELVGEIQVAPNAEGGLGTRVRDELLADYAFIGGVTVRPSDRLAFGLTYREASAAIFDLPITADLGESFGIPLPVLSVRGTAQYDPTEVALEASGRPAPWLLVGAGAVWQRWSAFPLPIDYTAAPAGTPPRPALGYSDTVSLRFGAEAAIALDTDATLLPRLGFAWEPSPVPEQTGFHNHLDADRLVFALGAGLRAGALRVDLAGQVHAIGARTHTKDPDLLADPAANPGAPSITGSGLILVGNLQLGLEL